MKKITIIVIIIILLLVFGLLLFLFNFYLNNAEEITDKNIIVNVYSNNNTIEQENGNLNTTNNTIAVNNSENSNTESSNTKNITEEENTMKLNIKIGDKNFTGVLYDNETTKSLIEKMPLTMNMSDLHSNEKYYYLDESLPSNNESVGNINAGDLMLYGSDCLVMFYESFSTSYSYTKLGYIDNPEGLKETIGRGNVEVTLAVFWDGVKKQ